MAIPQASDEIAGAATDVEDMPGSRLRHPVNDPPTVMIVVAPRMPLVEPVESRRHHRILSTATREIIRTEATSEFPQPSPNTAMDIRQDSNDATH
ncbi:hypothetical protein [Nocardia bovistercoris]|uniref:hypothetical protein n=1 Tax=Nocardia bovistercoris TaxID=2785916 RepID=UPI002FCD2EB2